MQKTKKNIIRSVQREKTEIYTIIWASKTLHQHKKKGCNVCITTAELTEKAQNTPNCEFCGIKLAWGYGKGYKPNRPTLDRINNEKNMTMSNTQILCMFCNNRKYWLTQAEYEGILNQKLMIEKI